MKDEIIHGFAEYKNGQYTITPSLDGGLPVIIGPMKGNADYFTDGAHGLILSRKRSSALVDFLSRLMCSLIKSEDLRGKLATEAPPKFGVINWDSVGSETAKVHSSS